MLIAVLALLFRLVRALRFALRRARCFYRRLGELKATGFRSQPKPPWVKREVIRLKALMPRTGCRTIATIFNRRFGGHSSHKRRATVGKTFVCEIIRRHCYEIEVERRRIKNARPRTVPKNLIWGIDLTGKTTLDGGTQLILGILEHASRAALRLEALENKSSWALIGILVQAIKRYGKPRAIRTDNESAFASQTFRLALFLLGIRHQRIDLHCPWQNGRVERLFGTLKEKLDQLAVDSFEALGQALAEFRFFYNHVRPHQNLEGRTPAEAWASVDPFTERIRQEYWFEAWDGLLKGYYLRR
jgi:putative transposase